MFAGLHDGECEKRPRKCFQYFDDHPELCSRISKRGSKMNFVYKKPELLRQIAEVNDS